MTPRKQPRAKKAPPPPTPKTAKAWDVPPFPKRGDADSTTTYAAVGQALSAWELFERQLANLFSSFVGDRNDELPALRAYGAIATFRGRVDMLRAAAEAHFAAVPNAHHERMIRKLLDTAQNYSQRRNEIAHGFVNGWRPEGTPVSEHGYVLMPFMHAPRKARFDASAVAPHSSPKRPLLRPTYLYSSAEIMVLCHRFQILTQEAVHLPTTIFYERRRAEKLGLLRK